MTGNKTQEMFLQRANEKKMQSREQYRERDAGRHTATRRPKKLRANLSNRNEHFCRLSPISGAFVCDAKNPN